MTRKHCSLVLIAAFVVSFASAPALADYLLVKAPSDVVAGEKFEVEVVTMTDKGGTAIKYDRKVTLKVDGQDETTPVTMERKAIFPKVRRSRLFHKGVAEISIPEAGWYRLVVSDGKNTTYFPVRCNATEPTRKLYWGEIHTHTKWDKDSWGGWDPYQTYMWGRNVGCLDFGTAVAHHWSFGEDKWKELAKVTNKSNDPGNFVTILGYEWGQGDKVGNRWNHNNVYFLGDSGPWAPNMKSVDEFWPWLDKNATGTTMCIPHHPALKGIRTEWDKYNPKYQRVVEIYSEHGNSERDGAALQGKCNYLPGYVQKALADGIVLGFIAGSDNHGGRMGTASITGNRQRKREKPTTGIAAVFADELTRKGIWDGLWNRRCYGTSGAQRIIIAFNINGHDMGQVFDGEKKERKLSVEVGGTTDIEKIEIVRNNDVFKTIKGDGWHKKIELTDTAPNDGKTTYYYVRVTQKDGNLAWSSPIWVK